jgi:hypothetical protein
MHSGRLSHLTNRIRMYKLQWVEGYRGFWLVTLKCDYVDIYLIWSTLLAFVWTDGARNSHSEYPD